VRHTQAGLAIEWSEYSPWIVQLLTDRTPAPPPAASLIARAPLKAVSGSEPLQWPDSPEPFAG
jgi:hypothetical protein